MWLDPSAPPRSSRRDPSRPLEVHMHFNRTSVIAGGSLIFLGLVLLVTTLIPGTWPVLLIGLGTFLLFAAVVWRAAGLTTSGMVNLALGAILLYQILTQDWRSWYFLWPALFAAVGVGMLVTRLLDPRNDAWQGPRYLLASWTCLGLGILAAAGLFAIRAQISWPSVLWSMGAMFLVAALVNRFGPLAVPGVLLLGLGLLLGWQNTTHQWNTWAFAWALVPAFTGLGMFLAFWRRRVLRTISLSIFSWSLVLFVLFGVLLGAGGALARYWPVALILGGLVVLLQALLLRRSTQSPQ